MRGSGFAATALVVLVTAGACTHRDRMRIETEAAKALVSDQQEAQIGMQLESDLAKEHVKYLQDPQVTSYVNGVFSKLASFATKDRAGVQWHVHVIDDPKTVNAFAVPGGHLFVYSGLLLAADDDAELAGVLGHEMGHVVARHAARNMVDAFGLEAVASLALGQNPSLVETLAAKVVATGTMLAHSRAEEDESDVFGAKYAHEAGYDALALADFFKKLQAQEGKTPQALVWISDHPLTGDRIRHVQEVVRANRWSGGSRNPQAAAAVKARIEQLGGPDIQRVGGH